MKRTRYALRMPCRPAASLAALAGAGALLLPGLAPPAAAAQPGNILAPNTLPVVRGVASGSAQIGPAVTTASGSLLTIRQQSQQAVIDWNSFNIAAGSEVRFLQPNETAEALNRIFDADPSIIQGRLTANGRIYLINSNGILFDRGSQVDTRGLLASSLALSKGIFDDGVFKKSDSPSLQGTLQLDANGNAAIDTATRPRGSVINRGTLRSVDSDTGAAPGGFILLLAPEVRNDGLIVADNGQVVLAAGQKAYLAPNVKLGTVDELDLSMRGIWVEIQAGAEAVNVSSLVSNLGTLQANRGNVSLAGLTVNQSGRISAGTSVNQNGSIWLLASEKRGVAGRRFGDLTLGAGSVTETPLLSDGTTLAESQDYESYRAQVKLDGATVNLQGSIVAQGGKVEIGQTASPGLAQNTRRVLLGAAASIDVSGATANLAMDKNYLSFKLTSDDLKNAPLQKGGFLLGTTVTVDMRKGSPALFDISAAAANVRRGIAEKAATGGDVSVASGEFFALPGSLIDVSGGAWRFAAGGGTKTTMLLSQGRITDIHAASADVSYDGVFAPSSEVKVESAKWGGTRTYTTPILMNAPVGEPGYVEGRAAGSLSVDASTAVFDGRLRAGVTAGPWQRAAGAAPTGARLLLGDAAAISASSLAPNLRLGAVSFGGSGSALATDFAIDAALPADRAGLSLIPADVFGTAAMDGTASHRSGFSSVTVYSGDRVEVAPGASLTAPAGAELKVFAHTVQVDGDIRLPSGSISLNARDTVGSTGPANVSLAAGRTISTAGQWINDAPGAPGAMTGSLLLDGGSVSLSGYNVSLGAGSLIDASAGARLGSDLKLATGQAGSITLSSGAAGTSKTLADFGVLRLDGDLQAFGGLNGSGSVGNGGALKVTAATALIGGAAQRGERDLLLASDFFTRGGFSAYTVTGWFDTELAPGVALRPVAQTRIFDTGRGAALASGAAPADFATSVLLPLARRKPASLTLVSGYEPNDSSYVPADGGAPGGLRIGLGASITTDPLASVTLKSGSRLDVDGSIEAPAGSIKLSLRTDKDGTFGGESLRIGAAARLLARGAFVQQPNAAGWVTGSLLRGGDIQFDVKKNDLVLAAGSLIDVGGATAAMDLPTANIGAPYARRTVGSEGGSIAITATENVSLAGTLAGAGGSGVAGGNFALSLAYHGDQPSSPDPVLDNRHHVLAVGQTQGDALPVADAATATVAADRLQAAGFGKIRLAAEDAIEFQGDTSLSLSRSLVLDTPEIGTRNDARVTLAAGQVSLINTPASFKPGGGFARVATRSGSGSLEVAGDLVELAGHLTLNGFSDTGLSSRGELRATAFPVAFSTSGDITLTRQRLAGSLVTPGDLRLSAAQVYPATAVDYLLAVADVAADGTRTTRPGGRLAVVGAGDTAALPLSAGGAIRFEADRIEHDGTVRAPLGSIAFAAASELALTDRSLSSVSGSGLTVPFGITVNGETLFYGAIDRSATPPEKRIVLDAPKVAIAPAAQIDIGGGGTLQSTEFVPGIGGSRDVLLAADTWAIVPGLRFASRDAMLEDLKALGFDGDRAIYDSVQLGAGGALPAGTYPLLPGYYALLPGAHVVTRPAAAKALMDLVPGTATTLVNGQKVLAGRFAAAASGETEARWSGFVVRPGGEVLREAEYRIGGNGFYADAAAAAGNAVAQLPADAGRLSIAATEAIAFGGVLKSLPAAGGHIGEVDIAAPNIAIVVQAGQSGTPAGFVELEAGRLSELNASVLLGGTRSDVAAGTAVRVVAGEVRALNDADHVLRSPELILAARDRVTVAAGAVLEAADTVGSASAGARDLVIADATDSGGALLRLSAAAPVRVLRGAARGVASGANLGELEVAAGAELRSSRSLLLDATTTTRSFGRLVLPDGGAASFSGRQLSIGETGAVGDGLVIDQAQLAALGRLGELSLRSYGNLDLYGNASFGGEAFGNLTIDAEGIVGHAVDGRNDATLQARSLSLSNSGPPLAPDAPPPAPSGSGSLTLKSQNMTLGSGAKTISGYANVKLAASGELTSSGNGSLTVAADLGLEAARIGALGKSNQTIEARDASGWRKVLIDRPASATHPATAPAGGGQLAILGSSIEHRGRIEMPSGRLELGARGGDATDDVVLAAGSEILAGAYSRSFAGTVVAASAGKVTLSSDHGSVRMASEVPLGAPAALLDLSGVAEAAAGELVVRAAAGEALLDGLIMAWGEMGQHGSASIDVGSLANFSALNAAMGWGGFQNRLDLRARGGDVVIGAGDRVTARDFSLVADTGSIELAGSIVASGEHGGGKVALSAGQDLALRWGSWIDARGTSPASGAADAYSHGGKVELTAVRGRLDFDWGAYVDASAMAAGKSNGGEVLFVAARNQRPDGTPGVNMNLGGAVSVTGGATGSAGSVIVEGSKSYSGVTGTAGYIGTSASNPVWSDYSQFMNYAAAIRGDLALLNFNGTPYDSSRVRVRAGIELDAAGDMSHTSAWDLSLANWRLNNEGGRLTLRSAGNLAISNSLGLPQATTAVGDKLPAGQTWSLRLVGGADLSSADTLATVASKTKGDVTLATTTARVSSGTGDIDIASGRDFAIANVAGTRATVFTAGKPVEGLTDTSTGTNVANAKALDRFATDGGDILINAARDVVGVPQGTPAVVVADWLRRKTNQVVVSTVVDGRWWVHRSTFRQAVGALGGGDVSIIAGGNITNLTAAVPTSARVTTVGGESVLAVTGGGNLNIAAGGDLSAGEYLVGRGAGTIRTGGSLGKGTATALYLMGESDDQALRRATFSVESLGDALLRTASNPTIMALTNPVRPSGDNASQLGFGSGVGSSFFTYAPDAALRVISVNGDVTPVATNQTALALIYPPQVTMTALQGSVVGAETYRSDSASKWLPLPSASTSVHLYASGDIRDQWVRFGDGNPGALPAWSNPLSTVAPTSASGIFGKVDPLLTGETRERRVTPAAEPGYRYEVIAADGDVRESWFQFPQQSRIVAGRDLVNLRLDLQNLAEADTSILRAGRDIRYGNFTAAGESVSSATHYVSIGGPGRLLTHAGRNIDFGPAAGIDAIGNTLNSSLPNGRSAALTVLAGVRGDVVQADIDSLFTRLLDSGLANDAAAGDAAIAAALGDAAGEAGNIRMVLSGIQTRGDSPIQVLAPRGRIDVGLPTEQKHPVSYILGEKNLQLGILTAAGGAIDVLVRDDILVNLSKIVTLLGGNIMIYSQLGGIDAGRGPRDSVSSLAPQVVAIQALNAAGVPVDSGLRRFRPPVDAAGSGMRTISFDPDGAEGPIAKPDPGGIYLFASRGFVDAGEAGVNAAGSLFVVAPTVINSGNFSSGGGKSGVPASSAGSMVGALTAASGAAAGAGGDAARGTQAGMPRDSFRPSFLTVEVIGFGAS